MWTQSLPGGKFKFQNPLRQNYRHTRCLSEFLGIEHGKFHSVVMFWGESTFKTPMPENVLDSGYTGYIKGKTEVLFSDGEVNEIVEAIQTGRLPRTWATRKLHINSLHARHTSVDEQPSPKAVPAVEPRQAITDTPAAKAEADGPSCPACGSSMVKMASKRGEVWSCSRFPNCDGLVSG